MAEIKSDTKFYPKFYIKSYMNRENFFVISEVRGDRST
jgi:hypothetical protein